MRTDLLTLTRKLQANVTFAHSTMSEIVDYGEATAITKTWALFETILDNIDNDIYTLRNEIPKLARRSQVK